MKTENGKSKMEGAATELVCIRCPIGCMVTVAKRPDGTWDITGNTCNRGAE